MEVKEVELLFLLLQIKYLVTVQIYYISYDMAGTLSILGGFLHWLNKGIRRKGPGRNEDMKIVYTDGDSGLRKRVRHGDEDLPGLTLVHEDT